MAFPLKALRLTSRRSGGETQIYPRLLRDRSWLPKIQIAISYFEQMLGRERRELETETLVHFLGDHRIARCVVAAMARSYRFRSRTIEEVVSRTALRRMQRLGVDSPIGLRLRLYDAVNRTADGFASAMNRADLFDGVERDLRLRGGELDRLLLLDAEEHAQLIRVGERPRPEDIAAQYNLSVLDTLLRHAERIELRLAETSLGLMAGVAELAEVGGVDANVAAGTATFMGRQDAMGLWSRHGRRVARALVQLLERDRSSVLDGTAWLRLRDRVVRLQLTPELIDLVGGTPLPDAGWQALPNWTARDLAQALAEPRGPRGGWALRRLPDPQAWAAGAVVPELLLATETERVLVCAVSSTWHGERLARLAPAASGGEPLVFAGPAEAVAPLRAVGARAFALARFDVGGLVEALRVSSPLEAAASAPHAA
jgi:predicted nuclease of restriction endonuclease-like RecB superfamily